MKHMIFVLLLLVLTLFGCDTGNGSGTSDLPVSTVRWELGRDGFIQFYTNDSRYYDYSFRVLYENSNGIGVYEIECKKISGYQNQAYGMIFGASDINTFYCINISASGAWYIWKQDGEAFTEIKDWDYSDKLYTGHNKINSIKVTKSSSTYTVFLNDSQVYQFDDTSITGNRVGYYVSVGSETNEAFPNTPVDVRFRQK